MKFLLPNVWNHYLTHLKYVMLPFQAVFDDFEELENIQQNKYRYHYLFDFLLSAVLIADYGVVYMIYGNDPTDPTLQHHVWLRFMPVFFRVQADTIFISGFTSTFFCYAWLYLYDTFPHTDFILLYRPQNPLRRQFVMPYRKFGLRRISGPLATKLGAFYNVYRKKIKPFLVFMFLELQSATTFPLVLDTLIRLLVSKEQDLPSLRVLSCFISDPLYISSLFSVIQMSIQFLCQNHVIQIKQRHYLLDMNVDKLLTRSGSRAAKEASYKGAYNKWRKLMGGILDITREIECHNQFYSRFITIIIMFFGFAGCSVLHAVTTKGKEAPILWTIPWVIYGCFAYFFSIFLFNSFSSMTIYLNVRIFKRMRELQIRLLSGRCLNRMQIVKLDLVNEYKLLLQKCSFRLMNSATINNELFFFQIFGCVSVFYMQLVETT